MNGARYTLRKSWQIAAQVCNSDKIRCAAPSRPHFFCPTGKMQFTSTKSAVGMRASFDFFRKSNRRSALISDEIPKNFLHAGNDCAKAIRSAVNAPEDLRRRFSIVEGSNSNTRVKAMTPVSTRRRHPINRCIRPLFTIEPFSCKNLTIIITK